MKRSIIIAAAMLLVMSCTVYCPQSRRTGGNLSNIGIEMFGICLENPVVAILGMVNEVKDCNEPGFSCSLADQTLSVTRIADNVWDIGIETFSNKFPCRGSLVVGYGKDPEIGTETLTCTNAVLHYDENDGYGAALTIKEPFVYTLSAKGMERRGVCYVNFTLRGEPLDWWKLSWRGDHYVTEDSI